MDKNQILPTAFQMKIWDGDQQVQLNTNTIALFNKI